MPNFSIATIDELPRIVDIYNQTIASREVTADLNPLTVEDRLPWFHAHNATTRPLWVITIDTAIVGWISLSDFYGRAAYQKTAEISIYLDKSFRGSGLGSQAITFVEKQLLPLEITTLVAFIFGHNRPSIALFERYGYQKWGHLPKVAELDGVSRDLVILGKHYSI